MNSPSKNLAKARNRVKLFADIEAAVVLLNIMKKDLARDSKPRTSINLVKDALLFVSTRRLDEFQEFLDVMARETKAAKKCKGVHKSGSHYGGGGSVLGSDNY